MVALKDVLKYIMFMGVLMMPYKEENKEARRKYDKERYDAILIKPMREDGEQIREHAKERDESLTQFLVRSAKNQITEDKK